MSFFQRVPLAPPDPILGLTAAFQSDPRKDKVNLGVGLYKSEDLTTPVLETVKLAEEFLLKEESSKAYLPIVGEKLYLDQMGDLVFGSEIWGREKGRIANFQTVGGTGALKVGGTFLKEEAVHPIWISQPTWPNHRGVFSHCGLKVEEYPYYNKETRSLDFKQIMLCLEKLSPGSIVLLHAACHNPTGCEPSPSEWNAISDLLREKKLIPFFDFAYQGFGKGIEEDAAVIRHFAENDLEFLIAVSNAKNFSLYGERVGCLFIVAKDAKIADQITSRVKQVIRVIYSNPPMHGAKVVGHILATPSLRKKWVAELDGMRQRIQNMRQLFVQSLMQRNGPVDFSSLLKGSGMFSFTGLHKIQVDRLREEYGIYMPSDGRINVSGLTQANIPFVVDAMMAVIEGKTNA